MAAVAFKGSERLVGEPAKNQAAKNHKNTVYDAKRLIGRKVTDATVVEDMKHWPFKVVGDKVPTVPATCTGVCVATWPRRTEVFFFCSGCRRASR